MVRDDTYQGKNVIEKLNRLFTFDLKELKLKKKEILLCDIIDIYNTGETEYYKVYSTSENKTYSIPSYQLVIHKLSVGQKHFFEKEQNPKSKHFFLNYLKPYTHTKNKVVDKYYEIGEIYEFNILDFESFVNKKNEKCFLILVEDIYKNIHKVSAIKWQNPNTWNHKTLLCEVEKIYDSGIPKLINKDFRHPFYKMNDEYEFEVIGTKVKETERGKYDIYQLIGLDGCTHEVNMLPSQKITGAKLEKITCKVTNITYRLSLFQVNISDPFFVTFEQIEVENTLKNKYFTTLFQSDNTIDKDLFQLIEQYKSKSAFWVFTYTNKILSRLFKESVERKDFKKAGEINKLIIKFERWIYTKGIIASIPDSEIRENTKLRAKKALASATILENVLDQLTNNSFNFLNDDSFFDDVRNLTERFYRVIHLTKFELIQSEIFLERLLLTLDKLVINSETDLYFLDKLARYISFSKKVFISERENQNFSLSSNNSHSTEFTVNENNYINWTYSEIIIYQKISKHENVNILCGQLLRLFTKSTLVIEEKEKLLFNAYKYFEGYQNQDLKLPINYDKKIAVNYDLLLSNEGNDSNSLRSEWDNLENLFKNKDSFTIRLVKKSKTGYEVVYKNLKGFLPYHHIKDRKLKNYPFEKSDFNIEARCLSISRSFDFFIVEQVENTETVLNHSVDLKKLVGTVIDASIKRVETYGLFLTTSIGEGLLHKSELFDFAWSSSMISKYFEPGQEMRVVVKNVSVDNKIEFDFKSIKSHDLIYYNQFVEGVFDYSSDYLFDFEKEKTTDSFFDKTQIEKAFCIEQYAVLQFDIYSKLQNFHVAKQFYTNAYHYRSFLINIYIAYFDILLKIKNAIESRSLDNIILIKAEAKEIKNRINQKTIETFPDSDKLLFFLDIIGMFNEKDESILDALFSYIKKYRLELNQKDLRTVAKITLANNLLLSESKVDSDFTLKNLRFIYDYLSNGVLSLEESIEDRNARELREEVFYWRERIKEDESETLEFKTSFYTPVLNSKALDKIKYLQDLSVKSDKVISDISRINGDLARKVLIHSCLKTLVAFANSAGGTLLIGVDNDKNIVGIDNEYLSTGPKLQYPNRDGFGLYFDEIIRNSIGDSFSSLMKRRFLRFPEGDVLIVKVEQSINEIFLLKDEEGKDCEQLYIRNLSSSKELTGSELAKFVKNRHMSQISKS